MSDYQNDIDSVASLKEAQGGTWAAISPEYAARMRAQNRFKPVLISPSTLLALCAKIWAEYDANRCQIHPITGLLARFYRSTETDFYQETFQYHRQKYLYLSGWMIAALRAPDFGPYPINLCTKNVSIRTH